MTKDTIAAIATGMTEAGISIIRISGEDAISVADKVFKAADKSRLSDSPSYTAHYGFVYNKSEKLDECIALVLRGPKSFTAEDTVELDCHGGLLVTRRVLEAVLDAGARLAEPGEFTKRAFLNGRIDLTKAEAVMNVIGAKNDFALKTSIRQLSGQTADVIEKLRNRIIEEAAFIEAALDDPEHYEMDNYGEKLLPVIEEVQSRINKLLKNAEAGRLLAEGIGTAIIGRTNAGKSSLLNRLLGLERAIVTDIPGTTRDVLSETLVLNNTTLKLYDTAGIRETDDTVEKIGVDRSRDTIEKSDLILYVIDSSAEMTDEDDEIRELVKDKNVIVVLNKSDKKADGANLPDEEKVKALLPNAKTVRISAATGEGFDDLTGAISDMFDEHLMISADEAVITNLRQIDELKKTNEALNQVKESIEMGMSEDFLSGDLMAAYERLGLITGDTIADDLADTIFDRFCMGK
ncbi:MAG: tRNA uridine-5-carboxymethylaminomethyl(34) synthesis GTPase MnmE [Lachnospiraceae bacterium]|nr:tRNA uridine-5-carboxymethylaminomethyl(34) synthesis GTPase MnmE [Lachnospiraceae bacterium]